MMNSKLHQRAPASARRSSAARFPVRVRAQQAVTAQTGVYTLPRNVQDMVDQAMASSCAAFDAGKRRQILQFINPVNEKAINFLNTDPVDYPCSNFKEFDTIVGVTKRFLTAMYGEAMQINTKRIDEGGIDGDLCAVVSTAGLESVVVVWPTAEKLKQIKKLAEDKRIGTLYIVNPLWKTEGNLVSEFGIGPWRKANEDFVATFDPCYVLYESRVGAPSSVNLATGNRYDSGAVLRIVRCFPGQYQAFVMSPDGASQAIGQFKDRPTYQQLDGMVNEARKAKMQIFDVAKKASNVVTELLGGSASGSTDGEDGAASNQFYSRDQIMDMDLGRMRRVLMSLGLPSSGVPSRLQGRLLVLRTALDDGNDLETAVEITRRAK